MSNSTEASSGLPITASTQDSDDNEFATPPEIWRPLARAVDGFDLDPASGAEPVPIAPKRFTKDDDGLSKAWHGAVFLNPPWSSTGDGSAKDRWLNKARNEANRDAVDVVVVLLPADTSAHWFHDHVVDADVWALVGPGRIPFIGEDRNPSFAMTIAAFGTVDDDLVDALDGLGVVVRGREVVAPTAQTLLADGGRPESADKSVDSAECPECGREIEEKDPLLGLWMCDDCEIGFNDNGAVIAE